MLYKCMHKKFGTVLYRREGDILTSLSWVLDSLYTNKETTYNRDTNNQLPTNEVVIE